MPKGKHIPEQIVAILRQIDSGEAIQAVCREVNISEVDRGGDCGRVAQASSIWVPKGPRDRYAARLHLRAADGAAGASPRRAAVPCRTATNRRLSSIPMLRRKLRTTFSQSSSEILSPGGRANTQWRTGVFTRGFMSFINANSRCSSRTVFPVHSTRRFWPVFRPLTHTHAMGRSLGPV